MKVKQRNMFIRQECIPRNESIFIMEGKSAMALM
jgi:hypothetical protein